MFLWFCPTPPAAVAEKDSNDDDDLVVYDKIAPEDLGNDFKSFELMDYAPELGYEMFVFFPFFLFH